MRNERTRQELKEQALKKNATSVLSPRSCWYLDGAISVSKKWAKKFAVTNYLVK